jgi:phycoerythrin-associated linker protein
MDIHPFLELYVGRWRSQRSDHQFGKGDGTDSRSAIEITALRLDDPNFIAICQKHDLAADTVLHPIKISWEEESLSSNKPKGTALIVPVPDDLASPQKGRILGGQSQGRYEFSNDESLTIRTINAQGEIEERIWYGNPNLRFRVATFLQIDETGDRHIQSSKFYSEIRISSPKQ